MKVRRRFLIALMASIMLHLGVVATPGWYLPALDSPTDRQPEVLDAHLAEKTAVLAPAARPVKHKRAVGASATSVPAPTPRPVEPTADPESPTAGERLSSPEPAEAPAIAAPPNLSLPSAVNIRYTVTMGESGFVIGRSLHELRHDNRTYTLRSTTETTGLAGLFKPIKLVHISEGDIDSGGLRPREFRIERNDVADERAGFDWSAGLVRLPTRGREFPLEVGTQDMLSMFCQLALLPIKGATVVMPVVTGKKVERYEFAVLGEEGVATGLGEMAAIHLRTQAVTGVEATEIWLGLSVSRLPVRIKHTDRKGDVFDQVADLIELGTQKGDAH